MALNRNNLKQTPIPVVSRTMQIVNTDGTVTRSGQLLLQQLQASDALQGTHNGRPAPGDAPDGALYVESDRLVLYSNIDGAWHYIAGTMWGTLSPDQRPTDLGVNDAGFDFRTVDQPAREFIWSQAYWVEVTPVRYGTHSARLSVSIPNVINQMLWVETDRGDVIYQLQSQVWHYSAGTMTGTLSPDQRPTDLGSNDTGFRFESTDTNQAFRWSGSGWVGMTPASPPSTQTVTSNALGVVYRNTTAKPRYVAAGIYMPTVGSGAWEVDAVCDSSSTPSTVVGKAYLASSASTLATVIPVFFVVLPNYYYMLKSVSGSPSVNYWLEWN